MTRQEYVHIRNLAWDILIDSKISSLPVDVSKIETIYRLAHKTDCSDLYTRMLIAADQILELYGMNWSQENSRHLTVRVLAPMIVLDRIGVSSCEELAYYTELPLNLAKKRFDRLIMLRKRNKFKTSYLESKVLKQFAFWINHLPS